MSIREAPTSSSSGAKPRQKRRPPPAVGDSEGNGDANGSAHHGAPQEPSRAVQSPPVAVRRVRRVVRHVDLWSVFRLAAMLYTSLLVVFMVAGVGLWLAATATGARHGVEKFIASTLLFKNFRFDSSQILTSSAAIGAGLVGLATGFTVVLAAFFNLISDVAGGLEFTVIEEEPAKSGRVS